MNVGSGRARMLSLNTPAGHERFFEAISRLTAIESDDARRKLMTDHGVTFHDSMVLVD
jgi:hypothetical protein